MPVISIFYGIIISMFAEKGNKHNTPHIHAKYGDEKAIFDLSGELLAGDLPYKKKQIVKAWVLIHEEDLRANWELCLENESPFKIEGLR